MFHVLPHTCITEEFGALETHLLLLTVVAGVVVVAVVVGVVGGVEGGGR